MRTRLFACAALGAVAGWALAAAPALAGPLHEAVGAPEDFKLRATIRSRTEAVDGQFRPAKPEDDFLKSFRTQIFAEYDAGPLRIGAELIDVRGYGQKRNSSAGTSEINALELSQAYLGFDLGDALGEGSKTAITAGRYILAIGSKRLMDGVGARNTVNAHTGAVFDWKRGDSKFVAFWSLPHIRLPEDAPGILDNEVEWDLETTDLQFFGASFSKAKLFGSAELELYAYGLAERDSIERPTANRRLFTPGARLFRKPAEGAFDFEIEGAYQFGLIRGSKSPADRRDLDVSAGFGHAEAGWTFAAPWSPRVSAHLDYASGDGPGAASYGRFDPLYGSRRTDFGPNGLYGPVSRSNLVSPGLRFEVEPNDRLDASLMLRALRLEEATDSFAATGVRDRNGLSGKNAGAQIEGKLRYWAMPERLRVELGAAYLAKGRFLTDAPNAPATGDSRFAYMDVTIEL